MTLQQKLKTKAQTTALENAFGIKEDLNLERRILTLDGARKRGPIRESCENTCQYSVYPTPIDTDHSLDASYILCSPRKAAVILEQSERRLIAQEVAAQFRREGFGGEGVEECIPQRVEYWGKVKITGGGDMIAAAKTEGRKGVPRIFK